MTWNWLGLAVGASLYMILAIPLEEDKLVEEFGEAYGKYQHRVPPWFPVFVPAEGKSCHSSGFHWGFFWGCRWLDWTLPMVALAGIGNRLFRAGGAGTAAAETACPVGSRPLLASRSISLVIVFIMLGGLLGALDAPRWTEHDVGWYVNHSEVRLSGVVVDLVDMRPASTAGAVRTVAADVLGAWEPVHGTVLVTFPAGTIFSCGDRLELQGSPTLPVEEPDFSYRAHLDRQGIHAVLEYPWLTDQPGRELRTPASLLCLVRQAADGVVVRILPQPESAILAGVVLGMDRDLPAGLVEAFRRTGTSHLLVVSGFNVTLIAGLVLGLLSRRLSPFRAALLAALAVLLYTLLVGADPPVLRAAIMALLGLGGNLLGRRQAGLNSLTLAAAVMALFEPGLLADPGFQLSFTATLGLIVYGTPFQDAFLKWTEKIPSPGCGKALVW